MAYLHGQFGGASTMTLTIEPTPRGQRRSRRVKGMIARNLRKTAERIIARERVESVTIRRLTREAGCSSPNFYNYYSNLDQLLSIIAAAGFDELSDLTGRIFSEHADKADALAAATAAFIDFYLRNRELARLMFRSSRVSGAAEGHAAANRALARLAGQIRGDAAVTEGSMDAPQFGIAHGVFAMWYGVAVAATEGLFELDPADKAELADFIGAAVRPFFDGSAAELIRLADGETSLDANRDAADTRAGLADDAHPSDSAAGNCH